jgi:hypothetical protein
MTAAVPDLPTPRQAGDNADREWARSYLSKVLGREIRGGLHVDVLVARLRQGQEAGK